MKQINTLKNLLFAACFGVAGVASAQSFSSHPYAFEGNFYKDYVGIRLQVTEPASIAGDYSFTTSVGTTDWGASVTGGGASVLAAPIINQPIAMYPPDTFGCVVTPGPGVLSGKIAFIWRGPAAAGCEFGLKAANAEAAGAIAVVLVNWVPGDGPVGMAAGGSGGGVTIPVFMVGNLDGIKISSIFNTTAPGTVKMTITPWGKGLQNDLGFVPGGVSVWHNFATPASQFAAPLPAAYNAMDGAFIANYGTSDAKNTTLATTVNFTPTGGSPTSIHTNTLTLAATPVATTFPSLDSIYAVFGTEYPLTGITGEGRIDQTYFINSDTVDQALGDNTYTHTFYSTSNIWSKGRYDFAGDHPHATLWTRPGGTPTPTDYMWGVPYFVNKGDNKAFEKIKFTVSFSTTSGPTVIPNSTQNFYVFKWVDGAPGAAFVDSAIESGELELVGATSRYFDGATDSSFKFYTTDEKVTSDTTGGLGNQVPLSDNTWYLVVGEMNNSVAMGCDGIMSQYPRAYGRRHHHNFTELYNPLVATTKAAFRGDPTNAMFSYFGGGGLLGNAYDVDSIHYNPQIGLIPALSFKTEAVNAAPNVKQIASKFEVFPNPTTDKITCSIELINNAKTVTYTILSSAAALVAKETRTNMQSDKFTYSTEKLAAGNYFLVVNVDGHSMFKKFTVIK
jgi:hypothetical protein